MLKRSRAALTAAIKPVLCGGTATLALIVANPAFAQCATTTPASTTTITCGDTVTTETVNTNGNNPSTVAYLQRFANGIDMSLDSGRTISGYGYYINGTGSAPITVTNNGIISNTTAQTTTTTATVDGLRIEGNGGAITYRGNGSVTTNAVPTNSTAVGLVITNMGSGDINLGSQATPITGATFRGEYGVDVFGFGTNNINAYFSGGTFEGSQNIGLSLSTKGNLNLVMTGGSVINGQIFASIQSNAPATSTMSVTTDARVTQTLGVAVSIGGGSGGTTVNIANGAVINGQAAGVAVFSTGGELRFTSAAGSSINALASNTGSIGLQLQPSMGSNGTVVADISGSISAGGAGIFLRPANGNVALTIREGATVSGGELGLTVLRINSTGALDLLNLGTISSPKQAASFDGTLKIGNGGTSGTITGNIDNRGVLIFNRSDALTYAQVISGTGGLIKAGQGTLTLSGANTFTGGTTVSQGTLNVTGSLTGDTIIGGGARLAGTGSVGALSVNGFLSPGGDGAIGTLTVNGNLTFLVGGSLRVDIGNAVNDRVNVTGTATLQGGVAAFASGGTFTAGTYTLLNAAGGISGTFSPLTTTPNATARLTYDANNVFLVLDQTTGFTSTTSTSERIVLNAATVTTNTVNAFSTRIVGRIEGGQPLYDQTFAAAFSSTAAQNGVTAARAAITTAGGPGIIIGAPVRTVSTTSSVTTTGPTTYALAGTAAVTTAEVVVGPGGTTIGQRTVCTGITALPGSTAPTCGTGSATPYTVNAGQINTNTNVETTYTINQTRTDTVTTTLSETYELNGQVVAVGSIHAQVQSGLFDLGGRLLGRLTGPMPENAGWAEFYAFRVNQTGRRDARGFAGGFNLRLAPGVTLAFGADRGTLDIDVPGAQESGKLRLIEGGAALRIDRGGFSAALSATYGAGDVDTSRRIIGNSNAAYDVRVAGVAFDMGYAIRAGGWTLRPVAGVDYVSIQTDGFTETDALGLVAGKRTVRRTRASAGLEVEKDWGSFGLAASARYLSVLDGKQRSIPVAFVAAPGRVLTMTAPGEPDTALIGARARLGLAKSTSLWVAYDGRFGKGYDGHAGRIGLSVAW